MLLISIVPYPSTPSFQTVAGYYSTGLYICDIDGNGYKDLIISNGNDMRAEPNHIYLNFSGIPSSTPSWVSSDEQFSGHNTVGDVNGDDRWDMVVAGFSGYSAGWNKQVNVLYLNGFSLPDTSPYWSSDSGRCFGVSSADINGDGFSDFAFFCGNDYSSDPEPVKLYLSNGSGLDTVPYWLSDSIYSLGGKFLDVDNDGDLDLFVGIYGGRARLYLNIGDTLERNPSWTSSVIGYANQVAVGDINNDGYIDVVVANMGDVHIYMNNSGTLSATPTVITGVGSYTSAVALGDINGDGYLDLAVGGWWDTLFIFENTGGNISSAPSWSWYSGGLVSEYIFLADINNDYLIDTSETFIVSSSNQHVFTLRHKPIHGVDTIYINGTPLLSGFVYSEEDGWVSISRSYLSLYDTVKIAYKYSKSLDMVVSNWEPSEGNYGFLNQVSAGVSFMKSEVLPDMVKIYDVSGRLIYIGKLEDFKPSRGVYFIKFKGKVIRKVF